MGLRRGSEAREVELSELLSRGDRAKEEEPEGREAKEEKGEEAAFS